MFLLVWTLCNLMRGALEGVSVELWSLLGKAVLLTEVSDALLSLKDFLLCHALQGLLPVLMHMDLKLVKKVLGLDVRAIFVKDVPVFDIRLTQSGVLMCFAGRNGELVC